MFSRVMCLSRASSLPGPCCCSSEAWAEHSVVGIERDRCLGAAWYLSETEIVPQWVRGWNEGGINLLLFSESVTLFSSLWLSWGWPATLLHYCSHSLQQCAGGQCVTRTLFKDQKNNKCISSTSEWWHLLTVSIITTMNDELICLKCSKYISAQSKSTQEQATSDGFDLIFQTFCIFLSICSNYTLLFCRR